MTYNQAAEIVLRKLASGDIPDDFPVKDEEVIMSSVKIIWATPEIDKVLGYITRVSNPANQANEKVDGLLRYCMTHGHVSPFEMANLAE